MTYYYYYHRLCYWLTKGQGRHALDSLRPSVTLMPCEFPQAINNLCSEEKKQVSKFQTKSSKIYKVRF